MGISTPGDEDELKVVRKAFLSKHKLPGHIHPTHAGRQVDVLDDPTCPDGHVVIAYDKIVTVVRPEHLTDKEPAMNDPMDVAQVGTEVRGKALTVLDPPPPAPSELPVRRSPKGTAPSPPKSPPPQFSPDFLKLVRLDRIKGASLVLQFLVTFPRKQGGQQGVTVRDFVAWIGDAMSPKDAYPRFSTVTKRLEQKGLVSIFAPGKPRPNRVHLCWDRLAEYGLNYDETPDMSLPPKQGAVPSRGTSPPPVSPPVEFTVIATPPQSGDPAPTSLSPPTPSAQPPTTSDGDQIPDDLAALPPAESDQPLEGRALLEAAFPGGLTVKFAHASKLPDRLKRLGDCLGEIDLKHSLNDSDHVVVMLRSPRFPVKTHPAWIKGGADRIKAASEGQALRAEAVREIPRWPSSIVNQVIEAIIPELLSRLGLRKTRYRTMLIKHLLEQDEGFPLSSADICDAERVTIGRKRTNTLLGLRNAATQLEGENIVAVAKGKPLQFTLKSANLPHLNPAELNRVLQCVATEIDRELELPHTLEALSELIRKHRHPTHIIKALRTSKTILLSPVAPSEPAPLPDTHGDSPATTPDSSPTTDGVDEPDGPSEADAMDNSAAPTEAAAVNALATTHDEDESDDDLAEAASSSPSIPTPSPPDDGIQPEAELEAVDALLKNLLPGARFRLPEKDLPAHLINLAGAEVVFDDAHPANTRETALVRHGELHAAVPRNLALQLWHSQRGQAAVAHPREETGQSDEGEGPTSPVKTEQLAPPALKSDTPEEAFPHGLEVTLTEALPDQLQAYVGIAVTVDRDHHLNDGDRWIVVRAPGSNFPIKVKPECIKGGLERVNGPNPETAPNNGAEAPVFSPDPEQTSAGPGPQAVAAPDPTPTRRSTPTPAPAPATSTPLRTDAGSTSTTLGVPGEKPRSKALTKPLGKPPSPRAKRRAAPKKPKRRGRNVSSVFTPPDTTELPVAEKYAELIATFAVGELDSKTKYGIASAHSGNYAGLEGDDLTPLNPAEHSELYQRHRPDTGEVMVRINGGRKLAKVPVAVLEDNRATLGYRRGFE